MLILNEERRIKKEKEKIKGREKRRKKHRRDGA
jgi:hypothetical protein